MQLLPDGGGAGGSGGVGGSPEAIEAGSKTLSQEAAKLASAAGEVKTSGAQAKGAAGDPSAMSAVASFTTAWSQYSTDLESHVSALSRLAQVGSQDLAKAGGAHTAPAAPKAPKAPRAPSVLALPGSSKNPFGPITAITGQAPGWHPPMQPGYVPPNGGR